MPRQISAGVLAWRHGASGPEFLLVHPGGPYWAKKDEGGWSIPKGVVDEGEETWAAAKREFAEELGQPIEGDPQPLAPCLTPGGKLILAWLVEADLDLTAISSNDFEIEWPPRTLPRGGPGRLFRRRDGALEAPQGPAANSRRGGFAP